MRAVALIVCLSMAACFPHNAKHRTYAKLTEGGLLVAGIGILTVANTGADCDMTVKLGMPKADCQNKAGLVSGIGLGLIIAGLVGFMATVSTAEDDKPVTPPTTTTPTPAAITPAPTAPSTTPTPIAQ